LVGGYYLRECKLREQETNNPLYGLEVWEFIREEGMELGRRISTFLIPGEIR
jgi:hypothetical protein